MDTDKICRTSYNVTGGAVEDYNQFSGPAEDFEIDGFVVLTA